MLQQRVRGPPREALEHGGAGASQPLPLPSHPQLRRSGRRRQPAAAGSSRSRPPRPWRTPCRRARAWAA
eukprot:5365137-Pyramimonas_sp.AAC.1